MTPTLARMVSAYERSYKKPLKWFALPQLFRYERQQKGRLREHFQFNADIIGEGDSAADAELIALLIDTLRCFGLTEKDFDIRLSSRNAWQDFFREHHGDAAQEYAFYQIIDKLERETPEQSDDKLKRVGCSLQQVLSFIEQGKPTAELEAVLRNLAARGLSDYVKVDYHVIRGLAYYTGVVFEAFDRKGEFRAVAGGGRYDNLVKLISGGKVDLPALGFGMGDVVLLELLKARALLPQFDSALDAFCLIDDEALRAESLKMIHDLRGAGLAVDYSLTPARSDKQFKRAQELKARHTIKLQRNATGGLLAQTRNLKTREEAVVPVAEAPARLREGTGAPV
jgi:histidyl-tRNA synthetase